MSFISMTFLIFILVSVVVYYFLPKKLRWMWLLAVSYFYYASSGIKFVPFIMFSTLTTYAAGVCLDRIGQKKADKHHIKHMKRAVLILGLILNFGVLGGIKYTNFVIDNINAATGGHLASLNLLLPIGISFYTFQSMGYLIDVYWGRVSAEKNPFRFALFVSFFPQILQGPIGRYNKLADQLYIGHSFEFANIEYGFQRILWGYFKKIVIADTASLFVSGIFNNYESFPGLSIVGVLAYSAQLYGDFSGGMDIVIGIAAMLGIRLDENFRQPFFSRSITDFWHRWHITLGTWMKDYVFYPVTLSGWMGKFGKLSKKVFGKKIGRTLPVCVANVIVFLVVGIWHGAAWTYICYGLYNGLIIAFSGLMADNYRKWKNALHINDKAAYWTVWQIVRTFILVNISWLFDMSSSLSQVWTMFKNMFTHFNLLHLFSGEVVAAAAGNEQYTTPYIFIIAAGCALIFATGLLRERGVDVFGGLAKKPVLLKSTVYLIMLFAIPILGQSPESSGGFIYAQF